MALNGKVALITGAASGIGRGAAIALGTCGAGIAGADLNIAQMEAVVDTLRSDSVKAESFLVDVAESSSVDKMVAEVIERFGQIDVLVHCAGIGPHGAVLQMTDEAWHRGINVNLSGAFYMARAVGREMAKRRSGTMIFFASDRGLYGGARVSDYAAAKGGVIAFTKSLALELAPDGITVNAINPGTTDTPLARGRLSESEWKSKSGSDPLGNFSTPEQIGAIVRFLAETAGEFMTGQLITTRMRTG